MIGVGRCLHLIVVKAQFTEAFAEVLVREGRGAVFSENVLRVAACAHSSNCSPEILWKMRYVG